MPRRRFALAFASVGILLAIGASSACSSQGEGDRCSSASDDCESGLVCKSVPELSATICCPQDPSQATTKECSGQEVSGLDSGVDAGDDTATADGHADAATVDSNPPGFGRSCQYNSQCHEFDAGFDDADAIVVIPEPNLVCQVGKCLYQCLADDDCESGFVCTPLGGGSCVAGTSADTGVAPTDTGAPVDSTASDSASANDSTASDSADGG